jgi:protein-disulfide isomerase
MECTMTQPILARALAAMFAGLMLLAPQAGRAQGVRDEIEAIVKDYLATHPDEVGEIVKGYLIRNPQAVGEILAETLKRRGAAKAGAGAAPAANPKIAPERSAAVADNAALLFSSPHQVTLGNPQGDVTLVEFFDYNCGFCKRALPDVLALIQDDHKIKVVLKEFPILGPGSLEAARVAVAVRMQDPLGERYLAFHRQLLSEPGPASREKALAAAKDQGLDLARLEADMLSGEVEATLAESTKLAGAVGITGTPGYVIGNNVVLGAVGLAALKERIASARAQHVN